MVEIEAEAELEAVAVVVVAEATPLIPTLGLVKPSQLRTTTPLNPREKGKVERIRCVAFDQAFTCS